MKRDLDPMRQGDAVMAKARFQPVRGPIFNVGQVQRFTASTMSIPVHFTCTFQEPQAWGMAGADWAERMAKEYVASGDTRYRLVEDPTDAAVIIFWEPFQFSQQTWAPRLRAHPLVRQFPNKVFIVSPEDEPLGFLSGLYCSLPKRLCDPERHRSWIYQGTLNPYIETALAVPRPTSPRWLAAFVGANSHSVRAELFSQSVYLRCDSINISETRNSQFNADPTNLAHKEQQLRYIETILDAKFSLCPRGTGTGSFRLQESMALGRAPVILSDQWGTDRRS